MIDGDDEGPRQRHTLYPLDCQLQADAEKRLTQSKVSKLIETSRHQRLVISDWELVMGDWLLPQLRDGGDDLRDGECFSVDDVRVVGGA